MIENMFALLFGLCWGSFLNVCIYRMPLDKSLARPGSSCTKCSTPIKWYDNVPVLSFLILGGQCRKCKEKISWRYPLVEIITGIMCLVLFMKFGLTLDFFRYAFFFCLLIVVSFIDIDYHAIPGSLCFIGVCVGFLFSIADTAAFLKSGGSDLLAFPFVIAFNGMIFGFGFSYMFKFFGDFFISFYLAWRKKESIEGETESLGLGDVDFMGVIGIFLGWKSAILIFFLAPFMAVVYAVFAFIFKKSHLIPYLPYLSMATLVVFFWGSNIWRMVFNF